MHPVSFCEGLQHPIKARRLSAMTDDEMEREMQGEPTPIMSHAEATPAEIVEANRGKIVNGLEKWL